MTHKRRTRPLPVRTSTIIGVPAPLHLPAAADANVIPEAYRCCSCHHRAHIGLCTARSGGTAYACMCSKVTISPEPDDTIVVDVEVNAAGQIVITGAERVL